MCIHSDFMSMFLYGENIICRISVVKNAFEDFMYIFIFVVINGVYDNGSIFKNVVCHPVMRLYAYFIFLSYTYYDLIFENEIHMCSLFLFVFPGSVLDLIHTYEYLFSLYKKAA